MSRDGWLPPGVSYSDIDPPNPCEGCEWEGSEPLTEEQKANDEEGCPGPEKCARAQGEPPCVDDMGPDE